MEHRQIWKAIGQESARLSVRSQTPAQNISLFDPNVNLGHTST